MKLSILVISGFLLYSVANADDGPALTPKSLQAALSANPVGPAAEQLAERVRGYFGGSAAMLKGAAPKIDELTVKLRRDAASRAIAGASSGGICAFTVAWERPDQFSKVLSWIGSFANIASGPTLRAGGHNYAAMIRKTPKKPIRVFLQDGANDLDNVHGNWPLANLTLAKSLAFARYDYRFEYGQGFHSNRHGRAILPDSLRWLWRDYQSGSPGTH